MNMKRGLMGRAKQLDLIAGRVANEAALLHKLGREGKVTQGKLRARAFKVGALAGRVESVFLALISDCSDVFGSREEDPARMLGHD